MNEAIPPNDAELLERGPDGKFTGRLDWRWRLYFVSLAQPLKLTLAVTMPPCPAHSSVDSPPINFPGVAPDNGMAVIVGVSSNSIFTVNNGFQAIITAKDTVILREFCVDAFGIGGFTDTYTLMAFAS